MKTKIRSHLSADYAKRPSETLPSTYSVQMHSRTTSRARANTAGAALLTKQQQCMALQWLDSKNAPAVSCCQCESPACHSCFYAPQTEVMQESCKNKLKSCNTTTVETSISGECSPVRTARGGGVCCQAPHNAPYAFASTHAFPPVLHPVHGPCQLCSAFENSPSV